MAGAHAPRAAEHRRPGIHRSGRRQFGYRQPTAATAPLLPAGCVRQRVSHPVRALCLAAALVLAGCSVGGGGAGDSGPTPTLTPVAVPEEGGDRGSAGTDRPAALRGPTVEPWELASGHAATLDGRSYTWVLQRERTVLRGELPDARQAVTRVVRVANATTFRVDRSTRSPDGSVTNATTEYAAGGTVFERRPPDGPVRSRPVERPRGDEGVVADRAEAVIARFVPGEATVTRRSAGGDRAYLVSSQGPPPEAVRRLSDGLVHSYRVDAVVRPDGRVGSLRARWREDSRTVVEVTFRYRRVGNTTVEPPAWAGAPATPVGGGFDGGFADDELRSAAAAGANGSTDDWVGWPAWATDD